MTLEITISMMPYLNLKSPLTVEESWTWRQHLTVKKKGAERTQLGGLYFWIGPFL